jgi:succinate-semialdehyde dehydrogenase/glutarate-semialdehyde dehydrogenase
MNSINPHNGQTVQSYPAHDPLALEEILSSAQRSFESWRNVSIAERGGLLKNLGQQLRRNRIELAQLMADEMGKPVKEGEAEIEKCAVTCDYYADEGEKFLQAELVKTEYTKSWVTFEPLGVILAIMPWNFPFWQVIRFAAPNLLAGNVGVLKHASNVSGCSLALETLFLDAGFPRHVFSSVLIEGKDTPRLIAHPLVKAVTITGSTPAGRAVAEAAGKALKKCVLELGGSDAYLVLADAKVDEAAKICAQSRLINGGQSCIAAKRFIVHKEVRKAFEAKMLEAFEGVNMGEPKDPRTTLGPQARKDLRDQLHEQVERSIQQGARLLCGGRIPQGDGAYYPPTILTDVKPGMTAFDEELFGPVAAIIEAQTEAEAIKLANQSIFGLGAAIFSQDIKKAERLATEIEAGSVFINALVKSDARLPFGGIKDSGYGRELSSYGLKEFLNIKTIVRA